MSITVLTGDFNCIAKNLDKLLLDDRGRLILHSNKFYGTIPQLSLRTWCALRGRYTIPTFELISWLKSIVGERMCIEIGAGRGDLCHHLIIPGTDSYMQEEPDIKAYYKTIGQATTNPLPHVEKLNAYKAIEKYSPQVVVGSWISQENKDSENSEGCFLGPDEEKILEKVETYIHIGNSNAHSKKRILAYQHQEYKIPFVTRAADTSKNVIWVWGNNANKRTSSTSN